MYQQELARCGIGQQTRRPPARQISTAPAKEPHPPSSPATGSPRHGPSPTGTMAPCTGQDRDDGPLFRLRPPPRHPAWTRTAASPRKSRTLVTPTSSGARRCSNDVVRPGRRPATQASAARPAPPLRPNRAPLGNPGRQPPSATQAQRSKPCLSPHWPLSGTVTTSSQSGPMSFTGQMTLIS